MAEIEHFVNPTDKSHPKFDSVSEKVREHRTHVVATVCVLHSCSCMHLMRVGLDLVP